ncbi:MAG: DEAD/DEAH box helicase [Bacteroidales bacterium]|nr:DEAD/DEAH box helicase [Bacteroidales bacterium]
MNFDELRISKQLINALEDIDIVEPTPIQEKCFPKISSGADVVGVAQTGTGKTFAYLLPIFNSLEFSEQKNPRVLVLVPTRELAVQVRDEAEKLAKYKSYRIKCVYGGANINTQKDNIYAEGCDVLIGTPGRIFDIAVTGVLRFPSIKKLVIDEVDEMLSLGFRPQLEQIFEMLPQKRQSMMFSSTLTDEVTSFIQKHFRNPETIEVTRRCTPVEKIEQRVYKLPNFNTKVNFLSDILADADEYPKVLVFAESKKQADRLSDMLEQKFPDRVGVTHSNKSQNFRFNAVKNFESGKYNILIATDVVARGIDFTDISHVINMSPPENPIDYIHRIGRTGRADKNGVSLLLVAPYEEEKYDEVCKLAGSNIVEHEVPESVVISNILLEEEKPTITHKIYLKAPSLKNSGGAFHERSDKRKKVNSGGLKAKAKRKRGK